MVFTSPYVVDYERLPAHVADSTSEEQPDLADEFRLVSVKTPTEHVLPHTLTTGYDTLLREIYQSGIWSWRKLELIIGGSHTELQRIAKGKTASPQIGSKIDALHQFLIALLKVTRRNDVAIVRVLSTASDRDGISATDHLLAGRFREAFGAVMDAVSPRASMPEVQNIPLRWYDRPSRDIHENNDEDSAD